MQTPIYNGNISLVFLNIAGINKYTYHVIIGDSTGMHL